MERTPTQPPRWQLILYASGSLSVALSYQAFATYIQFLYIDIFGLRAAWVGAIWSLYGLWNAVNDPLAGYLSDRTRTRWGRRIPWMAAAVVPLALTFYFLWVPPTSLLAHPDRSLLIYFLLLVLAFDLLWTIVVVNWTALFPEMVPGEQQRAAVSAWRQIFSVLGLLVGVALPPILAGADWSGRDNMAFVLTGVTVLFFVLALFGSRERRIFQTDEPLPLRVALRAIISNRNFRTFLAANLAIQFIFMMLTATTPFYTKYVLRIQAPVALPLLEISLDVGLQTSLFLGLTFIMALPAMPVWTSVTRRWGAWRTLRLACLLAAATLLLFFLPRGFYSGLLFTVFFGFALAALLMLPDLLIAAVVDADELETGTRREGLYFGMNGFVIRFAFTIQGLITGTILTLSGYVAPRPGLLYPEQPATALWGIRVMMAAIPALAAVLAFFILQRFTLHGDRLIQVQQAVSALHAQKNSARWTVPSGQED